MGPLSRWSVVLVAIWACAVPCLADDGDREPTPPPRRLGAGLPGQTVDTQGLVRRAGSIQRLSVLADTLFPLDATGERPLRPTGRRSASRDFLKFMVRHAQRSSGWELDRLQTSDLGEIESRQDEISRAAEKIFTRAADSFLGEQLESLLERAPAVRRFRDTVDHYTSVTFERGKAQLGADPTLLSSGAAAAASGSSRAPAASSAPRAFRATASFRLDAHPRLVLGARLKRGSARLEIPISGSEYRLSYEHPISGTVSGSITASRPLDDPEDWWTGMRFGIRF
jgi:hypothetical protein